MLKRLTAAAGSGKTYALTRHFLELLGQAGEEGWAACIPSGGGDGYGWPEIIAITFTNKAVAEMRARVIASLKQRALGQGEDGPAAAISPRQARRWLQRLLRSSSQLNIRTIDSLLHLCMRLGAIDLGLSPDFTVELDSDKIFQALFDACLDRAEQGEQPERGLLEAALDSLIFHEGREGFFLEKLLQERVARAFAFLAHRAPGELPPPEELERARRDNLAELQAAAADLQEALIQGDLKTHKNFTLFLEKIAGCAPGEFPNYSTYADKAAVTDGLLAPSGPRVTREAEARYEAFKEAWVRCRSRHRVVQQARQWLPFAAMGQILAADLDQHPHRTGVVSGRLWEREVARLLGEAGGVSMALCRLGAQLRHLLIDEFQDTSTQQWEALLPLARECRDQGGGLFLVGDVKQAIYGWRGGNWRLFEAVADDMRARDVSTDHLPHNWRSQATLVTFTNRVFSPLGSVEGSRRVAQVMAGEALDRSSGEELAATVRTVYREAEQSLPPQRDRSGGYVELRRLRGKTQEDVAEQVREALQEVLADLQGRRPWSDVAILVRANWEAEELSRWLIDWDIPLVTENSLHLAEHPLIKQLLAWLSFLDDPDNDLAFWNFLSGGEMFGAVGGLSFDVLVEWLARQPERPLRRAFAGEFPGPWRTWIEPFHRQSGLMSPYDLVQESLKRFRLRERHPRDEIFLRRFLELVLAAENQGHQSLAAFLDFWVQEGHRERIPLPEGVGAVQVLTIHKAKGLEFPVVIIPFHHWGVKIERLCELPWGERRVILPLIPEVGEPYYRQRLEVLLENLNLLYVGWTRAVEEFYGFITGNDSQRRDSFGPAVEALLAPLEWPEEGQTPYVAGVKPPAGPEFARETPPAGPEPAGAEGAPEADFIPMAWLPRLKIFRHRVEEGGAPQRRRGELVHLALEYAPDTGDPIRDARRGVELALAYAPTAGAEAGERADLEARVAWALGHPRLAALRPYGHTEVEILDAAGAVHRLDTLILTPREVVVLEFKTGSPAPEHRDQIRRYLELLEDLPELHRPGGEGRTIRGLLIYLDGQTMVEIPGGAGA